MRLGIFGGSFNPVHRGHLRLAQFAFSELNLDRLYFVPSCETPLKSDRDLLPAPLRVKLLEKTLKAYPHLLVSTCEMERGGKSYTVDTLRYFHKQSGKDGQLYFLTGMDSLQNIEQWKSPETIFELCRFVAATRPGYAWRRTKYPVIQMPFEALSISSSEIRNRLRKDKPLEGLVPAGIEADLKKYFQSKKGGMTSKRKKSWI